MRITDKRINKLIIKFRKELSNRGLDDILEHLEYPGGIVWITEKQYKASNKGEQTESSCLAYMKKVEEHGDTPGQIDIPLFKIILIKERVLQLGDKEFLHLLAHECSHILFGIRKTSQRHLIEPACDILAKYFFGFSKPRGATLGYTHDDEAFAKIYGKRKLQKIKRQTLDKP